MISLIREAARFDASESKSRRHVVRLKLQTLLAEARARSRFYAHDHKRIDALLEETDDDRFFDAFRGLRPVTREDLALGFDRITTDREIDRAALDAFVRAHPGGKGLLRTERGDHVVLPSVDAAVHVVDRARASARVVLLVLFRALFRAFVHAPRTLACLAPFRFFRRRARVVPASYAPSIGERLHRLVAPSVVSFVGENATGAYVGAFSGIARAFVRMLVRVMVITEGALTEALLARIAWARPDMLFGLPSRIEALALAKSAGAITLEPSVVYLTGERVGEDTARTIARAFPRAVLIETFGVAEIPAIATTCHACGALHVLEDLVHLETQDATGAPCRPGHVAARTYATALGNYTTPLIRYALESEVTPLPDAGCPLRTARIRIR